MNDILGGLIDAMISDYESYTEHNAESVHASPDLINYILAKSGYGSITMDKDGAYRIAGLQIVANPNMNRGKIEIR